MPPRQKIELAAPVQVHAEASMLEPGDVVNVVIAGSTRHKMAEVLGSSDKVLKIRTNAASLTQAEISLIPWSAIEGIGLIGQR
jgi:hypothetical protein